MGLDRLVNRKKRVTIVYDYAKDLDNGDAPYSMVILYERNSRSWLKTSYTELISKRGKHPVADNYLVFVPRKNKDESEIKNAINQMINGFINELFGQDKPLESFVNSKFPELISMLSKRRRQIREMPESKVGAMILLWYALYRWNPITVYTLDLKNGNKIYIAAIKSVIDASFLKDVAEKLPDDEGKRFKEAVGLSDD